MKKKLLAILCVAVLLVSLGSYAVLGAEPNEGEQDNTPVTTSVPEGVGANLTSDDSTTILEDATTSVSMVEDETEDDSEDEDGSSLPAFVYSAQPQSAEEVQAAWDAYVSDGAVLPRWEEAIDEAWVPEGAMQGEYTDAESGSVYYSLAPVVAFEYSPAPENRFVVWVDTLNYKYDPVLYPLSMWEEAIDEEWVPVGFTQQLMVDEETEAEYYTLAPARMARAFFDSSNEADINDTTELTAAMAAINGVLVPEYAEVILNLRAGFSGTAAMNNTSTRTIVVDGSAADVPVVANFTLTAGSGKIVMQNLTLQGRASAGEGNYEFLDSTFTGVSSGIGYGSGDIVVKDCVFKDIVGNAISGTSATSVTVTIDNSLFKDNYYSGAGCGAAINVGNNTTLNVTNSTFINNSSRNWSGYNGGAIAVDQKASAVLGFRNCYFQGNYMENGTGGAIGFYFSTGSVTVDQCVFEGNEAKGNTNVADGGAIAIKNNNTSVQRYATYEITNSTFANNIANDDGAAIMIEGIGGITHPNLISGRIENCTFYKNIANGHTGGNYGGAIQFFAKSVNTLVNNTFYANQKVSGYAGAYGTGSGGYGTPTINRINTLFVANTSGSGTGNTQQFSGGSNRGGDVIVAAAGTEAVFGTTDPQLAANGSGLVAGCDVGGQAPVAIKTLYIAPNMAISGESYADGKGAASGTNITAAANDERGFTRGTVKDSGAVEIVSARFDANGGAWSATTAYSYASPIRYSSDSKVAGVAADTGTALNAPAEGKLVNGSLVLLGWSTNSAATAPDSGLEYSTGTPTSVPINYNTDDVTYYAIWGTAPVVVTYTVTYNWNYAGSPGTYTTQTGITAGSTTTAPTAPTRSGYTFGGWFKETGCTNGWNFGSDTVNSDITLYAKWTQNTVPPTSTPETPSSSTPSSSSSRPSSSTPPVISTPEPASSSSSVPAPVSSISEAPMSNSQGLTDIDTDGPPLIGREGNHWALANLICAIVSLGGGAVALIVGARRKKDDEEEKTYKNEPQEEEGRKTGNRLWQILSGVSGVASPIVFFLTENMRLPMAIFDKWTPVMVAFLLAQGIFAVLQWNTKRKKDDDAEYAS